MELIADRLVKAVVLSTKSRLKTVHTTRWL